MAKSLLDFYGQQPDAAPVGRQPARQRSLLDAYQPLPPGRAAPQPPPQAQPVEQGSALGNIGRGLAAGGMNLVQDIANIPNLATGGAIPRALDFDEEVESMRAGVSPAVREQQQNIQEAEGFFGTLAAAAQNPKGSAQYLVESAPSFLPGLGAAKAGSLIGQGLARGGGAGAALMGLSRAGTGGLAAAAAQQALQQGARRGAAVGLVGSNAALSAGFAGSEARQVVEAMPDDALQGYPEYQALAEQGVPPDEIREQLATLAGQGALAPGALLGAVTSLIGAPIESRLMAGMPATAGGALGRISATGASQFAEEAAQEGGEQLASNIGVRRVNPEQSLMEGVPEAAAIGGIMGTGAGVGLAGVGEVSRYRRDKAQTLLEQAGIAARQAEQQRASLAERRAQATERVGGLGGLRERQGRAEGEPVSVTDPRRFTQPITPDAPLQPGEAVMQGTDLFEVVNDADSAVTLRAESGEQFIINKADLAEGYQRLDTDAWLEATSRTRGVRALPSPGTETTDAEFTERRDQRLLTGPQQTPPERKRQQAEGRPTERLEQQAQRLLTVDREKGLTDSGRETLDAVASVLLERPDADPQVRSLLEQYGTPGRRTASGAAAGSPPADRPSLVEAYQADQATPPLAPDQADQAPVEQPARPEPTTDQRPVPDQPRPVASTPEASAPEPSPDTADTSRPSQPPAGEDADSVAQDIHERPIYRGVRTGGRKMESARINAEFTNKGLREGEEYWTTDRDMAAGYSGEDEADAQGEIQEAKLSPDAEVLTLVRPDGSVDPQGMAFYNKAAGTNFATEDDFFNHVMGSGISEIGDAVRAEGYDAVESMDLDGPELMVLNPAKVIRSQPQESIAPQQAEPTGAPVDEETQAEAAPVLTEPRQATQGYEVTEDDGEIIARVGNKVVYYESLGKGNRQDAIQSAEKYLEKRANDIAGNVDKQNALSKRVTGNIELSKEPRRTRWQGRTAWQYGDNLLVSSASPSGGDRRGDDHYVVMVRADPRDGDKADWETVGGIGAGPEVSGASKRQPPDSWSINDFLAEFGVKSDIEPSAQQGRQPDRQQGAETAPAAEPTATGQQAEDVASLSPQEAGKRIRWVSMGTEGGVTTHQARFTTDDGAPITIATVTRPGPRSPWRVDDSEIEPDASLAVIKKAAIERVGIPLLVEQGYVAKPQKAVPAAKAESEAEAPDPLTTDREAYRKDAKDFGTGAKHPDVIRQQQDVAILSDLFREEIAADNFGKGIQRQISDIREGITRNAMRAKIQDQGAFKHVDQVIERLYQRAEKEGKPIPAFVQAERKPKAAKAEPEAEAETTEQDLKNWKLKRNSQSTTGRVRNYRVTLTDPDGKQYNVTPAFPKEEQPSTTEIKRAAFELVRRDTRKADQAETRYSRAQPASRDEVGAALRGRGLSGDKLADQLDVYDELTGAGAEIDGSGNVRVYHRTTADKAERIRSTGKMAGLEDGVFFSTSEQGQGEGYGDTVVSLSVPIERLALDDIFDTEAHVRIPTKRAGQQVDVSRFIDARYSRGQQSRNTAAAVRTELNLNRRAERALLDSGLVNIVQSASDIPGTHPSDVAGAYHQGKVYLVADNIPSGRAEGLLLHEIGVHHGLETMVGPEQYAQIVETLKRQVRAGSKPGASRAAREAFQAHVRASADSTVTNPDVLWHETIAYLAESGSNAPVLRRIMAAVRAFLRRLGLASDFTAADMAQLARGSIQRLVEGMEAQGQPATMYHRVFHGTPHLWQPEPGFPHGRPRLDKMGTGEGHQAYGWGIYLAEAEDTGRYYQDVLSGGVQVYSDGRPIDMRAPANELTHQDYALQRMALDLDAGIPFKEARDDMIRDARDRIKEAEAFIKTEERMAAADPYTVYTPSQSLVSYKEAIKEDEAFIRGVKEINESSVTIGQGGQLYHLDIPDNVIPTLLDWNKKLSEQPQAVQDAILDTDAFGNNVLGQWLVDEQDGKFVVLHGEFGRPLKKTGRTHATEDAAIKAMEAEQRDMLRFMTGEELYRGMVQATMETNRALSGPEAAKQVSEKLRDAGIPGNRYLDAGSRGTGDESQTRNVVLWDQSVLDRVALLKRNEEALDAIQAASAPQYSRDASQRDAEYLAAVERGDMDEAQRLVDEAAREAGYKHRLYHGTPTAGFTVFKARPTYLTPRREVADIYQSGTASSIRTWAIPNDSKPATMDLYVKADNIFDTRTAKHRRMFEREFFMKGGEEWSSNGTPLSEKKLPDWTDGRDLHEWFEETGKPFDAMILDEGGLPKSDGTVFDRGESVVVWNPEQIKSAEAVTRDDAGNVIPLSQRFNPRSEDVRYSRRPADTTDRAALGRSLLARNRGDVAAAQREAKALYPGMSEDIGDWIETNKDRWQESEPGEAMYSRADRTYTPEQDAALAKISPESPATWTRRKLSEALENWQYKLRQGTIDQFDKLLRNDQAVYGKDVVERNTGLAAWVLARMSKSAEGALQAMIYHGRPFMDNGAINVDENEKSLMETFAPLQGEVSDFLAWVAGNRAERLRMEPLDEIVRVLRSGQDIDGIRRDLAALNLNDVVRELDNRTPESIARQLNGYRGSGLEGAMQAMQTAGFKNSVTYLKNATRERLFDDAEIKALKALNQGQLPDGQDRDAVYRSVQRDFQQLQKAVLDIAESSGLINAQDRAAWEHDFYVPFYRVIEDDAGDVKTRGLSIRSGLVKQKAFERLKGGEEGLNDLLTNTLMNWNHLLGASLRNQAADRALDTAQKLGIATKLKSAGKGSVYVMRDGQPVHYQVDDPLTLEAITALDWQGMRNPAMRLIRGAKRLFTRVVTISPAFQIANLMRDSIHSIAVTKLGANPMANVARGWKQFDINRGKMLAGGGAFQFGARLEGDTKALQRHLEKQVKGDFLLADTPNKVWKGLQDALHAWDAFANRTENVNRAALYQRLRDQGHDHLYASFHARDLMDFSQTGAWASTRFLTMAVPFLNARLQGLDKLGRAGLDPAQRTKFALTVGAVMAASALLYLINSDDERFRELEEWQRDTYWWIFIGDRVIAIPKPFEVGALGTLAERALEQAVDAGADGTLFLQRLKHVLLETFSFNPTPQIVAPLLDLYANRDPFRDRPIESMSLQNMSPTQRATTGTSEFAKGVSWLLNPVLETATNSSLSPVQVDYLVAGYFGWIGQQALKVSDLAAKPAVGLPSAHRDWLYDTPLTGDLARRFLPDLDRNAYTKSLTAFYEDLRKKEQLWADFRTHREQGDVNAARGILEQEPGLQLWLTHARRVQRRLSDIRKQTNRVQRDGRLSAAERERRIRVLNQQRKDVARSFMSVQGE